MDTARYVPANRVMAGGAQAESLMVRGADGRALGTLVGLVIEPDSPRIRSLVVESAGAQREVPISPIQFDPESRTLQIVASDVEAPVAEFSADSIPVVSEDDLWVPLFHHAA
jgi:hypothetical protein